MGQAAEYYTLENGVKIPAIGFGTWQSPDGEICYQAVLDALEAGYRHIDTAAGYGNEESVGKAIKDSGIKREEIFVTSKLNNPDHGYENTVKAFTTTLEKLGLEYLDMYLIHWPNPIMYRACWQEANAGSWKAIEEFYKQGKIRAIGVSNFRAHHLEELKKTAEVFPMVNQIRLCPGETQEEVVKYSRENKMILEAYSPLGTGKIFQVEEMKQLAEKYQKSIAQICIRWSLDMGYLPLPKSVTKERIAENKEVYDFELSKEDVAFIANLTQCCGPTRDPDVTEF